MERDKEREREKEKCAINESLLASCKVAIERANEDTEHLMVGIINDMLFTLPICM